MESIPVTIIICVLLGVSQVTIAGFLHSPFPYVVNPGAPITSAASPFIHGFGAPLVSPFVNFYHPPLLKYFQPVFYHQAPQIFNLPAPQFYTLPETAPTSAPAPTYGPPKEQEEEKAAEPQRPVYGPPSASDDQSQQSFPSGFSNPDKGNRFSTGPSGFNTQRPRFSGPSGQGNRFSSPDFSNPDKGNFRSSGPSGTNLQVYEDDFRGEKESVIIDSERARGPRAPPPSNNFQSFIANSRDNSVKDSQGRQPFNFRPSTARGGY